MAFVLPAHAFSAARRRVVESIGERQESDEGSAAQTGSETDARCPLTRVVTIVIVLFHIIKILPMQGCPAPA